RIEKLLDPAAHSREFILAKSIEKREEESRRQRLLRAEALTEPDEGARGRSRRTQNPPRQFRLLLRRQFLENQRQHPLVFLSKKLVGKDFEPVLSTCANRLQSLAPSRLISDAPEDAESIARGEQRPRRKGLRLLRSELENSLG